MNDPIMNLKLKLCTVVYSDGSGDCDLVRSG